MKQNGPRTRLMIAGRDAVGVCLGAWHCPNFNHKRKQRTKAEQEASTHAPPMRLACPARQGGLGGAWRWLWWSLGGALVEPWGGFRVALGWLWGPNRLAINRLWCGFEVALYSGVYARSEEH